MEKNSVKPAFRKEGPVTVTLPFELQDRIKETAEALGTDFETAVATLLRIGLNAQQKRETEISHLVNTIASSSDPEVDEAAVDRLNNLIFGR